MIIQAIILAAGGSSRFWPLNKKHKSLFKVMGKPLIFYTLLNLKKAGIKEAVIVQGKKRDIEKELKNYYLPGFKIKYVVQRIPKGTGHAIITAKKFLKEKILILNGDDFYGLEDIKKCLTKFPSILVKEFKKPLLFGTILPEKNFVKKIVERSDNPPSNLVNAGCYFIPKSILKEKIEKSPRGEYEIVDYINYLAKKEKIFFFKAKNWFPLNYTWELLDTIEYLLKNFKSEIKGKVEKNCQIKLPVIIGKGTDIKNGSYVEGPVFIGKNCKIGPNCHIKPYTIIEDNCIIEESVEIKNSIISQGSRICPLSYIGDSIIGENCNLSAGTILANLRFDGKNIYSVIKDKKIDTQRKKFGAVLGSKVKTGINVFIMPGVLVEANSIIAPHSLIKENIFNNKDFSTKK